MNYLDLIYSIKERKRYNPFKVKAFDRGSGEFKKLHAINYRDNEIIGYEFIVTENDTDCIAKCIREDYFSGENLNFDNAGIVGAFYSIILLRFTGFTDIKGDDIYEGDILLFDDDPFCPYTVRYNINKMQFVIVDPDNCNVGSKNFKKMRIVGSLCTDITLYEQLVRDYQGTKI